jgi:excisionase family DNA binding protein
VTTQAAPRLLSPQEVANFLGIPLGSLYQWRTKGTAPRAVKVGRHIRFRQEDLDAWVERQADEPRAGAA